MIQTRLSKIRLRTPDPRLELHHTPAIHTRWTTHPVRNAHQSNRITPTRITQLTLQRHLRIKTLRKLPPHRLLNAPPAHRAHSLTTTLPFRLHSPCQLRKPVSGRLQGLPENQHLRRRLLQQSTMASQSRTNNLLIHPRSRGRLPALQIRRTRSQHRQQTRSRVPRHHKTEPLVKPATQ